MKFLKPCIFLLMITTLQCAAKPACECVKYHAESLGGSNIFVTNLYVFKKRQKSIVLKGNCVDVRRIYLFDENKLEYEKNEIACISKSEITVTVNNHTEISLYNSSKSAFVQGQEAREYFFNDLLKQKNKVFTVVYNSSGSIAERIQSADYLEESYLKMKENQKLIKLK